MSFLMYGGYFLLTRVLAKNIVESWTLRKTPWLFRLGVLSILPVTILYVLKSARDGTIGDPFLPYAGSQREGFSLVVMAVMMFPSILKMHLTHSDAYRASWILAIGVSSGIVDWLTRARVGRQTASLEFEG